MTEINLRDLNNAQFFNLLRKEDSVNFGDRVPAATLATLEQTFQNLSNYRPAYNSFISNLLNRIGLTIFNHKRTFQNPLAQFKSGRMAYGSVVQEIATGILRAHSYDAQSDGESVFSRETPTTRVIYHELNRQEWYKVTINRADLAQAFIGETGLHEYVEQLMSTLYTSDNLDEFNYMMNLFKMYDDAGGFWRVKAGSDDITNDADRARDLLKKIRAYTKNITFPNTTLNAAGMPTWAGLDELVLFTTPETEANIDVDALAAAFNIDRMSLAQRTVVIPQSFWPLKGVNAVLTSEDFFRVFDNTLQFTDIENPQSLNVNSFLHHWQIISCNFFVPAIAFTNDNESIEIIAPPAEITIDSVESFHIYPRNNGAPLDDVSRGNMISFDATLTLTEGYVVAPNIVWQVRGNESNRTYIDNVGNVFVGEDETATTLTVRAYPAGKEDLMKSVSIPVVGPILTLPINRTPIDNTPKINAQTFSGMNAGETGSAVFYVVASGSTPITFTFSGEPSFVLTSPNGKLVVSTEFASAGTHTFTATATNEFGSNSAEITLDIV